MISAVSVRLPCLAVWASEETLIADLHAAVSAVRAKHPDAPLYLLGESMGGAVIMSAVAALDGKLKVERSGTVGAGGLGGGASLTPFTSRSFGCPRILCPGRP